MLTERTYELHPTSRRIWTTASYAISVLAVGLVIRAPDGMFPWSNSFRSYYSSDQLSYAAIASNASVGDFSAVEPFTQTGVSFYPSWWYWTLGALAGILRTSVPVVWSIAGLVVVAATVILVGFVALRMSKRWWAPALAGPMLLIGPPAAIMVDHWYVSLESHAVLWGPYGALYTLNGEVVALCSGAAGLSLMLIAAWSSEMRSRARVVLITVGAALIGVTANLSLYAFLVAISILAGWAASVGLMQSRSRRGYIWTGGIALVVLTMGPVLRSAIGEVPIFGLLLMAAAPGVLLAVRGHWRKLAMPATVLVIAALPQLLTSAAGILASDSFLTYRVDQSSVLAVPWSVALWASGPITALWLFNWVTQDHERNEVVRGLLVGIAIAGVLLTFNDRWGFSQEPYRMWIDIVVLSAFVFVPITALSLARLDRAGTRTRRTPKMAHLVGWIALAFFLASTLNLSGFRTTAEETGSIEFDSPRMKAISVVTANADGLITSEPCINPRVLKIASRKPVAFYNKGLAWPDKKDQIDLIITNNRAGVFDADIARNAGVRYLVTDSSCPTNWQAVAGLEADEGVSAAYSDADRSGTITLWRLSPP